VENLAATKNKRDLSHLQCSSSSHLDLSERSWETSQQHAARSGDKENKHNKHTHQQQQKNNSRDDSRSVARILPVDIFHTTPFQEFLRIVRIDSVLREMGILLKVSMN